MENFIQRAIQVHGNKYDYSNVKYINSNTKVRIFCRIHNFIFEQSPAKHISGQNCQKCGKRFMDTNYFKEKASRIHLYKYDYTKSVYIDNTTNVIIKCTSHGEFEISPNNHLSSKRGCQSCRKISMNELKKITKDEFIEKSKEKYTELFDYSNMNYIDYTSPLKIICKTHGEIEIIPKKHLFNNFGCKKCGLESRIELSKKYKNISEFMDGANIIHSYKYDYSKSNYINCDVKIIIICKEHKEFEQTPYSHINEKSGCPKCAHKELGLSKRKTTNAFIIEAIKIHGNKYSYDKVEYLTCKDKVIIICPIQHHGDFEQTPNSHLGGSGCPKCANDLYAFNATFTNEEFIRRAFEKHGDRYDYSETIYINSQEQVKIICSEHGEFEQIANNHLQGYGCPKCAHKELGLSKRKTNEEFIKQSINVHGNKYNYDKVEYLTCNDKVIIICPIHGEFEQSPSDHQSGKGCYNCGIKKCALSQTFTQEEFIQKAIEKHAYQYNYEKVEYINSQTKIIITCNRCNNTFAQVPNSHLQGSGCDKCAHVNNAESQRLSQDEVIQRAKNKHGDDFDYSRINYTSMHNKITIICKKGHTFEQLAVNHIRFGYGCPTCSKRLYSKIAIEWLEIISIEMKIDIQHAENIGEHRIKNSRKKADGYNIEYNYIFEYHGCHTHGCLKCYPDRNIFDLWGKRTHNENNERTIKKQNICIDNGYKYYEIWDCEWKIIRQQPELIKKMINNIREYLIIDN
jgi:hypothetical protein